MDILLLGLSIFCSYRNALLAKRKGQNTVLWVFITMVVFWLFFSIGSALLIVVSYRGVLQPEALISYINSKPLMPMAFMLFGLGGYLFIRYLLERMPDKKGEE